MLAELAENVGPTKINELIRRVEHPDTKTALAAEAELSMLWAISKVAHLEAEPVLSNSSRRPDAFSSNLFVSSECVIDVRALSDESFLGKEAMDRTANIVTGYADQLRKGAGKHLYFEFMEQSYWDSRYHRERCVDPEFQLTPNVMQQLREPSLTNLTQDHITSPGKLNVACPQ